MTTQQPEEWREELAGKSPLEIVAWAARTFRGRVTQATAFGPESMIITKLISEGQFDIPVFTLDTGRLFQETYDLLERTRTLYDVDIKVYFPDSRDVEAMVARYGPNLFRDSVSQRQQCCHVRKVKPLQRALAGKDAWITGLRREQSHGRAETSVVEWDEGHGLYKVNPLWNWSGDVMWDYIREHEIPYNPLIDRGFASVGCAPCTRAVKPGEDPRAGRWWWESDDHKECGIHIVNGKVLRRPLAV